MIELSDTGLFAAEYDERFQFLVLLSCYVMPTALILLSLFHLHNIKTSQEKEVDHCRLSSWLYNTIVVNFSVSKAVFLSQIGVANTINNL